MYCEKGYIYKCVCVGGGLNVFFFLTKGPLLKFGDVMLLDRISLLM